MRYHLLFAAFALIVVSFTAGCSENPPEGDGGVDVGPTDGGDVEPDGGDDGGCRKGWAPVCDKCQPEKCQSPVNCAPGQNCQGRSCIDTFVRCAGATCVTTGQVCIQDPKGDMSCHYTPCDKDGSCPDMYRCFAGYCLIDLPCINGTCPDKYFCLLDRGNDPTACVEGQEIWTSCQQTCNLGTINTLKNPDTMSYSNCTTKVECECKTYPDVLLGDFGYFASAVISGADLWAAAYDRVAYYAAVPKTYGDLVVMKYKFDQTGNVATPDSATIEFVDGVPSVGTLYGNPNGPRKGLADPGDNVGFYTSIAVAGDGSVAVAYYDYTNKALKYAKRGASGWTVMTIEGGGENAPNVGRYPSLAFDTSGKPHISYFQMYGAPGADRLKSGLKLAIAKNAAPASSADWDISIIDFATITCRTGLCAVDEKCVEYPGTVATCKPEIPGCDPVCNPTESACVADKDGKPYCAALAPAVLTDVAEGVGLFTSILLPGDGNDYIAYYGNVPVSLTKNKGTLRGAVVAAGSPTVSVLDGSKDGDDDVGRFASLAKSPLAGGEFGVSYVDATAQSLRFWHGAAFGDANAKVETVTTGVTPGEKDYEGANSSLQYDANGKARIAFQDATRLSLIYVKRGDDGNPWPPVNFTTLLDPAKDTQYGKGGFGFFITQMLKADGVYISSVKIGFKTKFETTIPDTRMILLKKPL